MATTLASSPAACASRSEGPSRDTRDDARALARALVRDAATSEGLARVDRLLGEQRPVAAAEAIRDFAIPAAERTLQSVRDVRPRSEDGLTLQERVVATYERRIAAMRAYADALATAEEDFALLQALHAHRDREQETARVLAEVEDIAQPSQRKQAAGARPDGVGPAGSPRPVSPGPAGGPR